MWNLNLTSSILKEREGGHTEEQACTRPQGPRNAPCRSVASKIVNKREENVIRVG